MKGKNMKFLGNVIWMIFGGLVTCLEYLAASIALMVTIVGIPFGVQTLKIGLMTLTPFNMQIRKKPKSNSFLNLLMNIIWIIIGGIWIFLTHMIFGLLFAITIVGMPFARQHFKLASLSLMPFGKDISQT